MNTSNPALKTAIFTAAVIYWLGFKVLAFIWAVLLIVSMMVPALTVRDAFGGTFTTQHFSDAWGLITLPLPLAFIAGSALYLLLGYVLIQQVDKLKQP